MSAYNELQPYFDAYPDELRKGRAAKGYTLQDLADKAGVPYSNVCDISSGRSKTPSLFYAAACCKALDLSLDEITGLQTTRPDAGDNDRLHELEMENTRQAGEIRRLKDINAVLSAQLRARRPIVYALTAVCALLLVAVICYMTWDIQIRTAGLFQSAGTSVFAVFLGLIVVAAIAVMVYAVVTVARKK
nr:MAG TPA: Helix-turn-helix XRE-family like protein [Caudoviricetes sp.]